MKKGLILLIILIICVSTSLFAGFDFDFFKMNDPIYQISTADKYATKSTLNIAYFFDDYPRFHLKNDGTLVEFKNGPSANKIFGKATLGGASSMINTSYNSYFTLGFDMQYSLHGLFKAYDHTDFVSFDGVFFFGPALNIGNFVSLKYGIQHYSGHYADEILVDKAGNGLEEKDFAAFVYDGSLVRGISLNYHDNARIYCYYVVGSINDNINPDIIDPNTATFKNTDYKNRMFNLGFELTTNKLANMSLFLAADIKLSEYGKAFKYNEVTKKFDLGYFEDNPWKKDFTIGGGINIYDSNLGVGLFRIEAYYNKGAAPALNQYFSDFEYVTFGFTIAP